MLTLRSPIVFSAVVTLGCLVGGVVLVTAVNDVPAIVVAVVLSCGIATLTYAFLGGVSEAGFHLGAVTLSGSGAMLVGSSFLINNALDPQLAQIREERRVERFSFDFDKHVDPSEGWFALDARNGIPLAVKFTNPINNTVVEAAVERTASRVDSRIDAVLLSAGTSCSNATAAN
jgi:hypothetical protein